MVEPTEHKGHLLYGSWVATDNWQGRVPMGNEDFDYGGDADGSNAEWDIDGCATCEGTEEDYA